MEEKLIELENRIKKIEDKLEKEKRNKIIKLIVFSLIYIIIFVLVIVMVKNYLNTIENIFN